MFFKLVNNRNLVFNINLIVTIPVPKYVFWGLGTFWGVQKIIDLSTILKMLYEFGLIRCISGALICYNQYDISPFS